MQTAAEVDARLIERIEDLTDSTVCEVLRGIRHDRDYETARRAVLGLEIYEIVDTEIALLAADHYRYLRKRGITVRKTVDTLIAAFCIKQSHDLLHSDSDFDPFEEHLGLTVVN